MLEYSAEQQEVGRRRCRAKIVYGSWSEAEAAALVLMDDLRDGKLQRQKEGTVFAYRCDYCPHWHIGHQTVWATRRAIAPTGKEGWLFGWDLARYITRSIA